MAADIEIREQTADVDGLPVFWRSAEGVQPPVLYVHGVPTSSDDWLPFLGRTGGFAPDLPGFGRSGKRGDFPYSISGYERFLERFLEHLGIERFSLVVHDWGAVGLALAQRQPERVQRLVVINAVPFLHGYRWHRLARVWRTPVIGELAMGFTTRTTQRWLARVSAIPEVPDPVLDASLSHFDQGTQRAILRLYRSAPPEVLAEAGRELESIRAESLVVWGERDPYLPSRFGEEYARRLRAPLRIVPGAGHWLWLDRPEVVDGISDFLHARGDR